MLKSVEPSQTLEIPATNDSLGSVPQMMFYLQLRRNELEEQDLAQLSSLIDPATQQVIATEQPNPNIEPSNQALRYQTVE